MSLGELKMTYREYLQLPEDWTWRGWVTVVCTQKTGQQSWEHFYFLLKGSCCFAGAT